NYLMSQLFVVHGVVGDGVAVAVYVFHRERVGRTDYRCDVRIPDSQTSDEVRTDVAHLKCPTTAEIALQRQVPLLRVWRIWIDGRGGERSQVDRTVGGGAAVIQTSLTGGVDKDRSHAGIVNIQRSGTTDSSQPGKARGSRNEIGCDWGRRRDVSQWISQLQRG